MILSFGILDLEFAWNLLLGAWNFQEEECLLRKTPREREDEFRTNAYLAFDPDRPLMHFRGARHDHES